MQEKKLLSGRLVVATGDITVMAVEAIVNAANSSLMGGGGVDGAIHRAGGPAILAECRQIRSTLYVQGLPAGDAVATGGGRLRAKYVIHTVGPVWHGGHSGESELLSSCYRRSLEEAEKLKLKTIAFPAISTGVYGYPRELAALVSYNAVKEYFKEEKPAGAKLEKVFFVFFSSQGAETFRQAVGG